MSTSKITRSLTGAALAVAFAATAATGQDLEQITFAQPSPSAINSFPVFVAIGEGYFAEEGLEVTVEAVNGSASVLQALAAGQAHFGRPGPAPVLAARSRGVDAVFIYNVAAKTNFGIVVQEDSEFQAIEELKGNTIGVGTADGAEVGFARNVLTGAGMAEGTDFEFLTVGDGGPATAAFTRGDIVAYSASVADAAILTQRGLPMRDITPPEYQRFFGNGLATMGDTIRDNPELVEKFGRAFARGHAFALDDANRETVLAHLKRATRRKARTPGSSPPCSTRCAKNTIAVDDSNGLGYLPPEVWAEWQDSMVEGGDLSAPLDDLEAAYTNDFVAIWNEGLK